MKYSRKWNYSSKVLTHTRTHTLRWGEHRFINNCSHTRAMRTALMGKRWAGSQWAHPEGEAAGGHRRLPLVHTNSLGSDRGIAAWGHSLNKVYWNILHLIYGMCVVLISLSLIIFGFYLLHTYSIFSLLLQRFLLSKLSK